MLIKVNCSECDELTIWGDVHEEIEGDPHVTHGLHRIVCIDDFDQKCECQLTSKDIGRLEQKLADEYYENKRDYL